MTPTLSDQIREALKMHVWASGESYYAIAKACGVSTAQLYRFRDGTRFLQEKSLNRLGQYLRLTVRQPQRFRSKDTL